MKNPKKRRRQSPVFWDRARVVIKFLTEIINLINCLIR